MDGAYPIAKWDIELKYGSELPWLKKIRDNGNREN
jgi:hypothetical protein